MGYTKGEWRHTIIGLESKIVSERGGIIAHIEERNTLEELEANARLIAVAPDLYEACKEVVKAYKCSPTSMQPLFWLRCLQATAKVEGK